jgi:uncharacterized protein YegL
MTQAISVTMSRSALQSTNGELVMEVSVQAPQRQAQHIARMPFNISIALDVSSSMEGDKIRHAKQAAQRIIARLEPQDSCAVVTFSRTSHVLFPSAAMTPAARAAAIAEIEKTHADGNTALYAGWQDAVSTVEHSELGAQAIQRVFLLTDGEANSGLTDPDEIARAVAAVQQRGISTTTFGLGEGYNERLLGLMASAGEGNTYFIQDADDIDAYFAQELDQLFTTTLRNTQVTVTLPDNVSYEIVGERNHSRTGGELSVPLGALLSGEARTFMLYFSTHNAPIACDAYPVIVTVTALDEHSAAYHAECTATLTVAEHAVIQWEVIEQRAAALDRAAIVAQALAFHQRHDYAGAVALIAKRKEQYPIYARFGVYDAELERFNNRISAFSMKRERMHANDMVNSSTGTLTKYRRMLEVLIQKGADPAEIARVREMVEAIEEKYR